MMEGKGRGNMSEKREEGNGGGWRFPPRPTIFFYFQIGNKRGKNWHREKSTKLPSLFFFFFHPSTFIDKDIIVIISLSFHFSILPTKHGLKLIFLSLLCH